MPVWIFIQAGTSRRNKRQKLPRKIDRILYQEAALQIKRAVQNIVIRIDKPISLIWAGQFSSPLRFPTFGVSLS